MLEYTVTAQRIDSHGSEARTKDAVLTLDTDVNGRPDAFNPAELFLASIAACMIKGIERMIPLLKFQLRGVDVKLHGVRQDSPPKMIAINYELIVDTDEDDRRLALRRVRLPTLCVAQSPPCNAGFDPEIRRVAAPGTRRG